MNKGVENFFRWVYISANEIKFIKKEISFMRLSNIKKVVVSVGLALGLVSGSMVAFGAQSDIIVPGPIVATFNGIRATGTNATYSNATKSNADSHSSSSSSSSSHGGGSARPVSTNNTNTTNNVGPNGSSYNSNTANVNTNTNTRNVGPAGANNNGATKGDVTAAKRGRLNVPKTADASAMGLYAALLGLSAVGGALVVATKKKEN